MKLLSKSIVAIAGLSIASLTMAADPIVGNWSTPEGGVVKITQSGSTFTGKVIATKSGKYVGTTVVKGLKADGGGKYSGGSITDPKKGKTYRMTAAKSGNTLKLKGYIGPFSRSQTWKKQ